MYSRPGVAVDQAAGNGRYVYVQQCLTYSTIFVFEQTNAMGWGVRDFGI